MSARKLFSVCLAAVLLLGLFPVSADAAPRIWDEGVRDSQGTLFTCTVCGHQKLEPLDLSWIIYVVVAAVVAGGVVVFLMKKKKAAPQAQEPAAEDTENENSKA